MSKRGVHYRPQNYWQPGTTATVTAKVYGVDLGNGVYGGETFRARLVDRQGRRQDRAVARPRAR
ncbi:Ig-like domain-containing protein [Amycolatopsis taiwanensis]|uniref:Ig-like domain-containing protein n=1 Tax=Amycolatopsis taiwanensis TaxID=342230 RepID=UPI003CCC1A98